jgi:hypothetical protein
VSFYSEVVEKLRRYSSYLEDRDHSFASTYATIYFKYPDEFRDALVELENKEPFDHDAWKRLSGEVMTVP